MDVPVVGGAVGVGLLLLAFGLNLKRSLPDRSPLYLAMNLLGAALAAWYAFVSGSYPFVILEVCWSGVALLGLVRIIRDKKTPRFEAGS